MNLQLGLLRLPYKGTAARDHLASERTFLAWLRTSLGLASLGITILQLHKLHGQSKRLDKAVALSFISAAIVTLLLGTFRFFATQKRLAEEKFKPSQVSVGVLVVILIALAILTSVSL